MQQTKNKYIPKQTDISIKALQKNIQTLLHIYPANVPFVKLLKMKKVNKQCLLDTPRTVRVSEKTWQVIVQTSRP